MKILARSENFTHLPWAVKKDFPIDKEKKIQEAMTGLNNSTAGKEVLKAARVTNFHSATDADFAKVREITEYAIGEAL